MRRVLVRAAAGLAAAVLMAGCATDGGSSVTEEPAESLGPTTRPPVAFGLTFDGEAFGFVESVEAEPITVTFRNDGNLPAQAFFAQLHEGVTAEDVAEAFETEGEEAGFALITPAGSTPETKPGGSSEVTVEFPEGDYMVLGEGLERPAPFAVTAASGEPVDEPAVDVEVEIAEYYFQFSGDVPAGEATVLLTNAGEQGHEFTGAMGTPEEVLSSPEEDLQGTFFSIAPAPGGRLWLTTDFEAGPYVVACFFPDAETGKAHFKLGMKAEFTVA